MRAVPVGSLLVILLQTGCGGGGGGATPAGVVDAGADEAEGDDAGTAADAQTSPDAGPAILEGACNNLQPGAVFVQPQDSGEATPPAAEGGVLAGGVYHLVSTTYYPAKTCSRSALATTLTVEPASTTSGKLQLASGIASGLGFTESIRYVSAASLLATRIDCFYVDPGGTQGSGALISYTATATEIRLMARSPDCGLSVDSYQM